MESELMPSEGQVASGRRTTEVNSFSIISSPCFLTLLGTSQAYSAMVTIGGTYNVDIVVAVTSLSNEVGSLNARHTNAGGYLDLIALGNSLGYTFNGNTSEDRVTFNDSAAAFTGPNPNASVQGNFGSAVYNNPGVDILIFDSGNPPATSGNYINQYELVSASLAGTRPG